MKNFKEIAEKCLADELSGVFIFNTGMKLHSQYLKKSGSENYFYLRGFFIDKEGHLITKGVEAGEIINFIPDNMQEQIKIDIPEGKVPVMESSENGVIITWKEKELTYTELSDKFKHNPEYIHASSINSTSRAFFKKVEVLRKLTNIRNYFGKPDENKKGWFIDKSGIRLSGFKSKHYDNIIIFAEKEHAQAAIKMLGDELKYLFEPW